jgi:arabinan endo-1,5-alpha-L-arabinosidase
MVGRGSHITGPYTDKNGTDMMTGAAEQLLVSEGRSIGPGGVTPVTVEGSDLRCSGRGRRRG